MTNLTKGQQKKRSWDELILAILDDAPEALIMQLAEEYASSGDSLADYQSNIQETLKLAYRKAQNFTLGYQSGRAMKVKKNSTWGRAMLFGNKKKKDGKK